MKSEEMYSIIKLKDCGDERGKLVVIEENKTIPFEIRRVFYMYGSDAEVTRGKHANKKSSFVLINVAGSSKVRICNGEECVEVHLCEPMVGLYIPPMIWKEMYHFSSDSIMLVLSDEYYDEEEYIRDYDDYIRIHKKDT